MDGNPPILLDLYCGRGGWTKAALAQGWTCIGIDIADAGYPATLIKRSLPATLAELMHFGPHLIIASPPCEQFARRHLPWIQDAQPLDLRQLSWSIDLARSAPCPVVVECSKFAARHAPNAHHCGSYAFWGDVPAIMPRILKTKTHRTGEDPGRRAEIPPELAGWVIEHARRKNIS